MTWILVVYFFALNGDVIETVKGRPMEMDACMAAVERAKDSLRRDSRVHFRCAREITR